MISPLLREPAGEGLLTAAGRLPSLLFSLPAAVRVDRRGRRRRTMIGADLTRAALPITLPAAYSAGVLGPPQLYTVTFAIGVTDVFFAVADSTLFVSVVAPTDHVAGQSLLNGSRAVSGVGGPSLARLLQPAAQDRQPDAPASGDLNARVATRPRHSRVQVATRALVLTGQRPASFSRSALSASSLAKVPLLSGAAEA